MPQNRSKLIDLFIGNISNAIVHKILERSINKEELTSKYRKELITSYEIAKRYREKINPTNMPLPIKDIPYIKNKIANKVRLELLIRISKGYEINLGLMDEEINKALKDMKIL